MYEISRMHLAELKLSAESTDKPINPRTNGLLVVTKAEGNCCKLPLKKPQKKMKEKHGKLCTFGKIFSHPKKSKETALKAFLY